MDFRSIRIHDVFRTTYGYLLSNYTNYGDSLNSLFVDRDTDGIHMEGGNENL